MPSAGHYTHSLTHLTTAVKTDKVTARKLHIFFLVLSCYSSDQSGYLLTIHYFFLSIATVDYSWVRCFCFLFWFANTPFLVCSSLLLSFQENFTQWSINLKEKEADITFLSNAAEVFQMASSRNILSHISTHARTCSARANHVQSISHTFQPHAGCPCDPSLDPHHMLLPHLE